MQIFVGIVEAGSISGAAERLGLAKSVVPITNAVSPSWPNWTRPSRQCRRRMDRSRAG
jgi:hypothetical protein